MASFTCPVCEGPVEIEEGVPTCEVGHVFPADELPRQTGVRATHALWAAVRALEDQAATARWRASRPDSPSYMADAATAAAEHADLLRRLLHRRDGGPS